MASQAQAESLHPSFDFTLAKDSTASYVTGKDHSVCFPSSGSSYRPNGIRQMNFTLSSHNQFLDLSTLMLRCRVHNTHDTVGLKAMNASGGALFRRVRLLIGVQPVEDIQDYNRLHVIAESCLLSKAKRANLHAIGFGAGSAHHGLVEGLEIAAGSSRLILWKPLLGICSMPKLFPVWAAPITLELELADYGDAFLAGAAFAIESPVLLCNTISADSSLLDSYKGYLANGGELTMAVNTFCQVSTAVTGPSFDVHLNRSLKMASTLYLSLQNDGKVTGPFPGPDAATANTVEVYAQVGSKRIGAPYMGLRELLFRLQEAVGVANSAAHSLDITESEYSNQKFVVAIDLLRLGDVKYSGQDLLAKNCSVHVENFGGTLSKAYLACAYEAIVKIGLDTVSVFT